MIALVTAASNRANVTFAHACCAWNAFNASTVTARRFTSAAAASVVVFDADAESADARALSDCEPDPDRHGEDHGAHRHHHRDPLPRGSHDSSFVAVPFRSRHTNCSRSRVRSLSVSYL